MILLGEDSWKLAFGFLQTLPHMSVFDYALHPFMVISHTRDMTIYLLGPLSPLRESPNLGGWSEGLDIFSYKEKLILQVLKETLDLC